MFGFDAAALADRTIPNNLPGMHRVLLNNFGRMLLNTTAFVDEIATAVFEKKPVHYKADAYIIGDSDLLVGERRLLAVDNPLILPTNTHIRLLITASDVLHSFAMPALGIKVDAVPGRLSATNVYITDPGIYYGQCSEICGTGHGFMPFSIIAVKPSMYLYYAQTLSAAVHQELYNSLVKAVA